MNFSGSITFTIETEDDIILAAQLIQHKRDPSFLAGKNSKSLGSISGRAESDAQYGAPSRPRRTISDYEVVENLRISYPTGPFTSTQADKIIKNVAGISSWTASRIRGKAIESDCL